LTKPPRLARALKKWVAYLAKEEIRLRVGFDEVVSAPFDGIHAVLQLPDCINL
jgi:hypothetical protein